MKATIYFSEINQFLSRKGINATLSSGYDTNTFRVQYTLKILFVRKDVSATIRLKSYSDTVINLGFSFYGLGSLENNAKNVIRNKLPNFITMIGDNELKMDLANIPALKRAGIRLSLNNFAIHDSGFAIDVDI